MIVALSSSSCLGTELVPPVSSLRRLDASVLVFLQFFLSKIKGDGCNDLLLSEPARARAESLLLASPPFVDTEHDVSLLSVDEGEFRLGLDFVRFSLRLFLCCEGPLGGSRGLARGPAEVGLRILVFPLRADLIV